MLKPDAVHATSRLLVFLFAAAPAAAQITVEGVADQTVYADRVSFRIPAAAGYEYTASLNGAPVAVGVPVDVGEAEYYELLVRRRLLPAGAEEERRIQFIVRSSARGNSEWGLPPWVPYPSIDSAGEEFAGARLEIMVPRRFPRGLEIPVVARVFDAAGKRVGVNGRLEAAGIPGHSIRLLRGVGAGYLPAALEAGAIAYAASLRSLSAAREIEVEGSTSWSAVSGALSASTDWGEDARIHVTGDLTVAAGAVLAIGAGSVIKLSAGADLTINGKLTVNGTPDLPVVFLPASRSAPWGGLILRTSASQAEMEGAILTGSGADPDWFDNNPGSGSSHRGEQPLFYLGGGARATLTDCALIDGQGQAGHGEGSFLTMTRCLVERFITAGQYNSGSVTLDSCALVEFPSAEAPFADDDNDGLYLTGGSHSLTECLVGWALDDGIDAGSGPGGPVSVLGCWIESCYHEGMAWSETRLPDVRDTVVLNCGQGIECGFGSPRVAADHILSTANLSGARFGDNYDWDYDGFLQVTNSLLLYNKRDIWGRNWDDWTERLGQMDLHDNFLSAPDPNHLRNALWQPQVDAARLTPFLPTPAAVVGVGIATPGGRLDLTGIAKGVPVRLSTFTTRAVSVGYAVESEDGPLGGGTLGFAPGETVKRLLPDLPDLASREVVRVTLRDPVGVELTGTRSVDYSRIATLSLIPQGSRWRYFDRGAEPPAGWRTLGFDHRSWGEGAAELGFGDGDERTTINGGPDGNRYRAAYFRRVFTVADPAALESVTVRLRRDDGAVVYINGGEVFRSNLRDGEVTYSTLAVTSQTSESAFFDKTIGAEMLVPGENLIAVEVHQAAIDSSDMSFELELIGTLWPPTIGGFVRGDPTGDRRVDIADPVKVLFVLFAGSPSDCDDALDADDSGALDLADAIFLLDYLFRAGSGIAAPFPAAGEDPTPDALECERG